MSPAFYTLYAVLWALVVFQGLVILGLFREILELKERALGGSRGQLPTGTRAPTITGTDLTGNQPFNSADFLGSGNTVVLFVSPVCKVCRRLADGVGRLADRLPDRFVAVSLGDDSESRTFVERMGGKIPVVADASGKIGDSFHVDGVPTAVALDGDGAILGYNTPQLSEGLGSWLEELQEPRQNLGPEDAT